MTIYIPKRLLMGGLLGVLLLAFLLGPQTPGAKAKDNSVQFQATPYQDVVRFKVLDSKASGEATSSSIVPDKIRVQVFNLAGQKVYDSGEQAGWYLDWDKTSEGEDVANGVYLWVVSAWVDGEQVNSKVGKLGLFPGGVKGQTAPSLEEPEVKPGPETGPEGEESENIPVTPETQTINDDLEVNGSISSFESGSNTNWLSIFAGPSGGDIAFSLRSPNTGARSLFALRPEGTIPNAVYSVYDGSSWRAAYRFNYLLDEFDFYGNQVNNISKLGVGTASPSYLLDVAGQANAQQLCIDGDCRTSWPTGGGSGYWNSTDSDIYNTNSGNVGIGTANPESKLHLYGGDVWIERDDDQWTGLFISGAGDDWNYAILGLDDNTGPYKIWNISHKKDPTHNLQFRYIPETGLDDSIVPLTITPDGHVGIGSEATVPEGPTEILSVGDETGVGAAAIMGWSPVNNGVAGFSDSLDHSGIEGRNTGSGNGIFGWSDGNWSAIYGYNEGGNGAGVWGSGTNGPGVVAYSRNGTNIIKALDGLGTPSEIDHDVRFRVERTTGDVYADGTFNPGGADVAELLPGEEGLEPGDVLVVKQSGKLARSTESYQSTVVGIYSTKPGLLGNASKDQNSNNQAPLAVVGIVPVKASAENGPIKPGDSLTTANTPGHAMRADPITLNGVTFYPSGAIIGKALESLKEETGTIKMLVMLQ